MIAADGQSLDLIGLGLVTTTPTQEEVNVAIGKMMSGSEDFFCAESDKLRTRLASYIDVMSTSEVDLGRTSNLRHTITTDGSPPIKQAPCRLPFNRHQEVWTMLNKMLQCQDIEPASGPWSSPIVLVKKKYGSTRFCVDFQRLNNITKKDTHPLPRIDDTLDALSDPTGSLLLT